MNKLRVFIGKECKDISWQNLLKVPETFALKMSQAADIKLHFLIVETLSICSITWDSRRCVQVILKISIYISIIKRSNVLMLTGSMNTFLLISKTRTTNQVCTLFFSSFSKGSRALNAWRYGSSSQPGNAVLSIAIMALTTYHLTSNKSAGNKELSIFGTLAGRIITEVTTKPTSIWSKEHNW